MRDDRSREPADPLIRHSVIHHTLNAFSNVFELFDPFHPLSFVVGRITPAIYVAICGSKLTGSELLIKQNTIVLSHQSLDVTQVAFGVHRMVIVTSIHKE